MRHGTCSDTRFSYRIPTDFTYPWCKSSSASRFARSNASMESSQQPIAPRVRGAAGGEGDCGAGGGGKRGTPPIRTTTPRWSHSRSALPQEAEAIHSHHPPRPVALEISPVPGSRGHSCEGSSGSDFFPRVPGRARGLPAPRTGSRSGWGLGNALSIRTTCRHCTSSTTTPSSRRGRRVARSAWAPPRAWSQLARATRTARHMWCAATSLPHLLHRCTSDHDTQ